MRIYLNRDVEVPDIGVEGEMDFYSNDGEMYMGFGEYEKALTLYKKMIGVDPEYFDGYRRVGLAYAAMGKMEEAIRNNKIALKLALKSNAEAECIEYRIDEEFIEEIRVDLARWKTEGHDAKEV
jgi:tetratricopeptide (TPR) repeat protein